MQQITKFMTASRWLAIFVFTAVLFVSCNSGDNTDAYKPVDSSAVQPQPAPDTESLPPIDSTASSRPVDGKT